MVHLFQLKTKTPFSFSCLATLQAAESSNSNLAQIPEEDPCLNIECLNGGSCVVLDGGGSVSCICLDGYEGLRCQNNKTCRS